MLSTTVAFAVTIAIIPSVLAALPETPRSVTKKDLISTDKEVTDKLNQLHTVIDALQKTVKGLNEGYDQHAREDSEKMQQKFDKLTNVISKLGKENKRLYNENKQLKQGKTALVDKISTLETELQKRAEGAKNAGAEAWLRHTAQDLKEFLVESGLEHFASPQFSPLIAGIVSNGVVIMPLAITSLFMLRYVKHLTVLRVVMALNLFDLGFVVAMIASCALLLGDSFEGLKHISEVNFMFIQLVVATVFWFTCAFLVAAIVQNRKCKAWKYALLELVLRVGVAADYATRVWSPVMNREDVTIALPAVIYFLYFCSSVASLKLTAAANTYSTSACRVATSNEDQTQHLDSIVVAQRDE